MFSIIVCTRNRPDKILDFIRSAISQSHKKWELIIIDLSSNKDSYKNIKNYLSKNIRYFKLNNRIKTLGLNFGIKKSAGDIIAFTDDDCLLSKNWLTNSNLLFKKHRDISAVFGQTLPFKPKQNKNKFCPSTFYIAKTSFTHKPCYHAKKVGFGNNMFIRKSTIDTIGGFKSWLGPGSFAKTAEDAEIVYRILKNKFTILTSPKPVVYHNKWLSMDEFQMLLKDYLWGELICYTYIAMQGELFAIKVVTNTVSKEIKKLKNKITTKALRIAKF